MLFNSLQFIVFFVVITVAYFQIPHRLRWFLLLVASCYFYMAFVPVYITILGGTIVIDYFAGLFLEKAEGKKRKLFLIFSLIANIGVLAVFKYYNFINQIITDILSTFTIHNPIPALNILLPIGLSFHTFQAMSYTIEVYRRKQKAEHNFGIYALYVMFYPQLVAGPIERPQNLLHQFHEKKYFSVENLKIGLQLIAWGFFKKVVIADRLAIFVDAAYGNVLNENGLNLLVATVFYSFQIYCDFSGYSEIAIGTAKVMGFDLMQNFSLPYLSKSISEFWKRWHISLSTWFKDYLYISLGGNRVEWQRWYFNLFIVFLISGLWHGANWTFIIWGALHGFYLIFAIVKDKLLAKWRINSNKLLKNKLVNVFTTYILVCLSWVFFRASSASEAVLILKKIFAFSTYTGLSTVLSINELIFSCLLIVFLLIKERSEWTIFSTNKAVFYWFKIIFIFILCYFLGVFSENQFIYFQF